MPFVLGRRIPAIALALRQHGRSRLLAERSCCRATGCIAREPRTHFGERRFAVGILCYRDRVRRFVRRSYRIRIAVGNRFRRRQPVRPVARLDRGQRIVHRQMHHRSRAQALQRQKPIFRFRDREHAIVPRDDDVRRYRLARPDSRVACTRGDCCGNDDHWRDLHPASCHGILLPFQLLHRTVTARPGCVHYRKCS
jgi:hypothetical protein